MSLSSKRTLKNAKSEISGSSPVGRPILSPRERLPSEALAKEGFLCPGASTSGPNTLGETFGELTNKIKSS